MELTFMFALIAVGAVQVIIASIIGGAGVSTNRWQQFAWGWVFSGATLAVSAPILYLLSHLRWGA